MSNVYYYVRSQQQRQMNESLNLIGEKNDGPFERDLAMEAKIQR